MRAAYYEMNGTAREVLRVGEVETPQAGPGEVTGQARDVRRQSVRRQIAPGHARKIAWPRVIPQSDGAGVIDQVGDGVPQSRIGERVWIWNGQWKRAFGTAAEYIALPSAQAVSLPGRVSFEAGACLGIPAMTAYHAVTLAAAAKGTVAVGLRRRRRRQPIRHPIRQGGGRHRAHHHILARKGRGRARRRRRPRHRLQARGCRRAGDGDHRQARRRRRDRDGSVRQRQADSRPCCGRRAASSSTAPDREAVIPAAFCLVNTVRLQFFLVYELDAGERERTIAAINRALSDGR